MPPTRHGTCHRRGGRHGSVASRGARVALGCAVLLAAITGCRSSVAVTAPALAGSPACQQVGALWPQTVSNQPVEQTSTDSPAVHAWGDPAIIARCGVSSPGPTAQDCIDANGVDWVAHQLSDGYRFTTYGRDPAIEVLVPSTYAPEPLVLSAFARAARSIPQSAHRCRSLSAGRSGGPGPA